ncbi:MAG: GNAT family N-acetyltransferase [Pseudobdellovibrionaceae bacterium]|nr:GNAT family N-acetyltransferase [Bdellovibrionales bacterium]USN47486.1 MAG: GNAT family N-acetyltransferase [Pseudobdellovibrionaceae bacterium]
MRVEEVQTKKQWRDFFYLPYLIYKDNPYWVPKPPGLEAQLLDVHKNPYFKNAVMLPLLAYDQGQVVGRVCGFIDKNFSKEQGQTIGVFGFLEYLPKTKALPALIAQLEEWFGDQGVQAYLGPMNPSLNGEVGVLTEGFRDTPYPLMNYAREEYKSDLLRVGLEPYKQFFAYEYVQSVEFPKNVEAHQLRVLREQDISIRPINLSKLNEEMAQISQLANSSMKDHWGFTAMTDDDTQFLIEQIRTIIDPNLFLVAEVKNKIVGFLFALPNINQFLIRFSRPLKVWHLVFLWLVLKSPFRKLWVQSCRLATLGVSPEYQKVAIGPALYCAMLKQCRIYGYKTAEASWVMEDNKRVNRLHQRLGATLKKKYHIFRKTLGE